MSFLFIWFLSVLLFFFSKKILRYSQYNGIYSVWNETGGGGIKYSQKQKQKKQTNKQTHIKETGSKAVSIDTTVKTMIPWRRTYKKPLNCNSGDWSRSSPPPCALAMSCNLDWNQATNLTDNSKQGVSCLANGECRLITSQSVHYHSSYHQLKYLKLKNKSSLLCCWHSVLTDKNHPSFKQYKLWLWVISKALVQ